MTALARRSLGRMTTYDLPPIRDASAKKTEVCRYAGKHYVAEREGDELVVYALHDEHGVPAVTGDGRATIRSLADLNRRNVAINQRRA